MTEGSFIKPKLACLARGLTLARILAIPAFLWVFFRLESAPDLRWRDVAHRRLRLRDPERLVLTAPWRDAQALRVIFGDWWTPFQTSPSTRRRSRPPPGRDGSAPGRPWASWRWALSSCGAAEAGPGARAIPCPRMRRASGRGCFFTPWWAASSWRYVSRGTGSSLSCPGSAAWFFSTPYICSSETRAYLKDAFR